MAVSNEILVGRYNRFLQKLTAIKGGPPAAALAGEIMPTFPVEPIGVENLYLGQWNYFGNLSTASPVIGQQNGSRYRNPSGSNIIAIIEKLLIWADTATKITLSRQPIATDLTNVFSGIQLDTRSGAANSNLICSANAAISVVDLAFPFLVSGLSANLPVDLIVTERSQIPILPGDAYQVRLGTSNLNMSNSIIWRERFLEDSERA